MMRYLIALLLCLVGTAGAAQDLTLDECLGRARENYPLVRKYALIEKTRSVQLSEVGKSWLPRLGVYAQATVQNDVPQFPDEMTAMLSGLGIDMPGLRKDQYRAGLEISQTVWDGGKTKADKEVIAADAEVRTASNDVELDDLEDRVRSLYFAILLADAQVEQTSLTAELLSRNLDRIRAMVSGGTAVQSDADAVEAEYLSVCQRTVGLKGCSESYRRMLEVFTGSPVLGRHLVCPSPEMPTDLSSARPELLRFDAQLQKLESERRQIGSTLTPKLGFFVQTYYGYPGYDYFRSMMNRDWTFNLTAGLKISWNIDAFYTRKSKLAKVSVAGDEIRNAREVFLFNTGLNAVGQQEDIKVKRDVIAEDDRIVELRSSVRKAAESRLENGVIDTTDLLGKITDESMASLNAAYHRIELVKTVYELKYTLNR